MGTLIHTRGKADPSQDDAAGLGGGVWGQISLSRLCDTLEHCGETQPNETITHLVLEGRFLKYRVERKKP